MIVEDLRPLAVPIDKLTPLPGNARRGVVLDIARSLDRFGQRKPVVAKRDGTVEAGNHTLAAALELGWDEIAVVWVDDDPTTAKAYAITDNRMADLAGYDEAALHEMILEVQAEDAQLLAVMGYADEDLDDLLAASQEEADAFIEHVVDRPDNRQTGSFGEPTLDERLEDYRTKTVRSFVLDYDLDTYERLASQMAELRTARGVESNAELLRLLVEEAAA